MLETDNLPKIAEIYPVIHLHHHVKKKPRRRTTYFVEDNTDNEGTPIQPLLGCKTCNSNND